MQAQSSFPIIFGRSTIPNNAYGPYCSEMGNCYGLVHLEVIQLRQAEVSNVKKSPNSGRCVGGTCELAEQASLNSMKNESGK